MQDVKRYLKRLELTIEQGKIHIKPFDETLPVDERKFVGIVRTLTKTNMMNIPTEYLAVLQIEIGSSVIMEVQSSEILLHKID